MRVYVESRGQIFTLDAGNGTSDGARRVTSAPLTTFRFRLGRRLLRIGVHALCPQPDGSLVGIVRRGIWRYDAPTSASATTCEITRGSRPLFLCDAGGGELYFGEYFDNAARGEVHVYRSADGGRRFDIAHTFPPGTIRHIHGVFTDPYSDALWLTTGDEDRECGLWITQDRFASLERVAGGAQRYRAVQLLFTPHFVYYGSDAPDEQNSIFRLDRRSGRAEPLAPTEGPVFYGCTVGDAVFFSTVVEPSRVNRSHDACLLGSRDGESWSCLARYRKDPWPMKAFQYGQLLFPSGENKTGRLWFTPFATEQDQTLQCAAVEDLF